MGPGKKEIRIQENMDPGPDPIVLLFSLANLTSSNSNLKKRSLLFAHPNWNWNLSLSLFLSLSPLLKAHFPALSWLTVTQTQRHFFYGEGLFTHSTQLLISRVFFLPISRIRLNFPATQTFLTVLNCKCIWDFWVSENFVVCFLHIQKFFFCTVN